MGPLKYTAQIILVIVISGVVGCSTKEVVDPPIVEDVPQVDSSTHSPQDIEDFSSQNEDNSVIEQITAKPEQKDTAVTYPKLKKIKKYERVDKDDSWFLVGGVTGDRAYSIFVDPDTIESENNLTNSWSKLEFEKTQRDEDGLSYKEVRISSTVDCENRTYSYKDSKFYDSLGRLVESQPAPYEPKPIVDGTVSSQIADFVCGYQLNRPNN